MIDELEYNSTRVRVVIPEYGRNIQKMTQYCVAIEDRKKRLDMAEAIVSIMTMISGVTKDNSGEHNHKFWDHLYIISDWELDVDGPYDPPSKDITTAKPQVLGYNEPGVGIRHYGRNISKLIDKACELEEGESKDATVMAIANQMKKSYLKWNRDTVNDLLIINQLEILSDGRLKLADDTALMNVVIDVVEEEASKKKKPKPKKRR